ncbi:ABC transporter substrate-binding protein [Pleionea sp. CnH1-48]|uniref:ABC transporter substrate-binding protein n=1 Tax=Pleionea sp. CnH1-48 TaxID=2954494 RepID=UPI002096C452|nr:ABC transporter substrate-binding protein [Pleionea sp. CnH1-48]MCO7225228.1 ABC transporter substrate-binding protein [Pleionea sp. CnH1-48]
MLKGITQRLLLCSLLLIITSCTQPSAPVKIAINPWPGYEFLYLAEQKGFFADENLNIKLVQLASLGDVQRAYLQGRVDGMASTVIEVVQVASVSNTSVDIILIPDYSMGGDVIIAQKEITTLADLKNKRVAAEVGSLDVFLLALALKKANMRFSDIQMVGMGQLRIASAMLNGEIDAAISYPPHSIKLLSHQQQHVIFSSADVPKQIIDTISLRGDLPQVDSNWLKKFYRVWQRALDFAKTNPEEAHQIMATREGISSDEFEEALSGMVLLTSSEQRGALTHPTLQENVALICHTLLSENALQGDCEKIQEKVRVKYPE